MPHRNIDGRALRQLPLKFHLTQTDTNVFTAYGEGWVEVNRIRHETSLVVLPDSIVEPWATGGFEALAREDFATLLDLRPEIVLLGTGGTIRFPHPRIFADLHAARIGTDVMDARAACRTFNVLSAEGRRVAAAILL